MTENEEWYSLIQHQTVEHDSVEKTHVTLIIMKQLGEPSFIQVPDSQFQLKLVFLPLYVKIYWRTLKLSDVIALSLVAEFLIIGSEEIKKEIDFNWVKANKWQDCVLIRQYEYPSCLQLTLTFSISLAARLKFTPAPALQELIRDFETLLTNNDGSNYDATIKSVEGEEFKAHKIILSVRCKVLKAHFEHNTTERSTGIVETPWEAKVLRDVLTFLYTGSAPGIYDEPEKILAAADFYQMEGLKSLCVETMIEMLTIENAIATLQVALMHSVDTLRDQTLQFIKDGYSRSITKTEAWANVSYEIIKMIYEFITADEKSLTT